jgi:hypothetical protein
MKQMAAVVAVVGVMAVMAAGAPVPEQWLPVPVLRPIELVCTGDDCYPPEPVEVA